MNKFIGFILISLLGFISESLAQSGSDAEEESIFVIVEKMPEFPGGKDAMDKYFEDNIVYPPRLQVEKLDGDVIAKFYIDTTGKVIDTELIKKMPECPECEEEVLRLLNAMPDWKPALQRGKPVKIKYLLPVTFKSGKYTRN